MATKFSKRHYEAIAAALANASRSIDARYESGETINGAAYASEHAGLQIAAAHIASAFMSDNGAFDVVRFGKAALPAHGE